MAKGNQYFGVGIYPVPEAARLTRVPSTRIRRWLLGHKRRYRGSEVVDPPVIERQLPDIEGQALLGFLDLMEVRFIDAFKQHQISLQAIRLASRRAGERFHVDHPLSSRRFKTDGRTVFAEIADETGEKVLLDLVKDQFAFERVLAPYLYEGLVFSGDDELLQWWPAAGEGRVILDPRRCYGQPIIADAGVPTEVIVDAFEAGVDLEEIAQWYELSRQSVEAALQFERSLAA